MTDRESEGAGVYFNLTKTDTEMVENHFAASRAWCGIVVDSINHLLQFVHPPFSKSSHSQYKLALSDTPILLLVAGILLCLRRARETISDSCYDASQLMMPLVPPCKSGPALEPGTMRDFHLL